jgi:dTDP-4-dehydrorhamnose reductase
MRVLVMGATGLLGGALLEEWRADQVIGVGSRDADVRDDAQVRRLLADLQPDWTVLAAAYSDVDGCERDPERANQVNCTGALNVARTARAARSKLLFVSTDYVFDGAKITPYEPDDPVNPLNVYGHSKAQAEKGIRQLLPDCCIVRTSWLFGARGRCFPNTILERAVSHKSFGVVADQTGKPTFIRDLAQAVIKLVQAGAQGTVHVTNQGECSWYEFARQIVTTARLTDVVVEPIRTQDFPRPARRPRYSALSCASMDRFGARLRPWLQALPDYFADLKREQSNLSARLAGEVGSGVKQYQGEHK